MKAFSAEESLWLALPLLIIIIGLAAVLIVFQTKSTGEIRSKASEPAVVVTPVPLPKTEVACSAFYAPVCGSNHVTYLNSCEANQAGISNYQLGTCPAAN